MYDRAAEFWQLLLKVFGPLMAYEGRRKMKIVGQMWSSHQRFFRWVNDSNWHNLRQDSGGLLGQQLFIKCLRCHGTHGAAL